MVLNAGIAISYKTAKYHINKKPNLYLDTNCYNNLNKIMVHFAFLYLVIYNIVWTDLNTDGSLISAESEKRVPFQLIPYHSLLTAMIEPASAATRPERAIALFQSLPTSKILKAPGRQGRQKIKTRRRSPYQRQKYRFRKGGNPNLNFRRFKISEWHKNPPRVSTSPFVPGGIGIDLHNLSSWDGRQFWNVQKSIS